MSYDKNNIKNTTEDGIADLVRDIISVPFSLDYVFTQIKFKPYRIKIKKALLERDEEDWSIAHLEDSIDSYREYLSHYSRETPYYTGIHIVEAEEAIRKLKEAEQPIEPEGPIEPEEPIIPVEPKATNTQIADIIHLISVSAHRKELDKEDNTDWLKATSENVVSSYLRYIQKHLDNPYGHVGKHVEEAKRQHLIAEDNSAWETAREVNTRQGYETYLSKYKKSNGLHVHDAQNAILKLQEEKDWETACSENTLVSYKKFVTKYEALAGKYLSAYLSCAKKKIEELTPNPLPLHPKWAIILLTLVLCWFLWIQWHDNAWPFNITTKESPVEQDTTVVVEEVPILPITELDSIAYTKKDSIKNNIVELEESNATDEQNSTSGYIDNHDNEKSNKSQKSRMPVTIKDFEFLAKQGDKTAYAKLAKLYLAKNNYDKAAYWADKAWYANVGKKEASEVIKYLDAIDYYTGAKYKNPIKER